MCRNVQPGHQRAYIARREMEERMPYWFLRGEIQRFLREPFQRVPEDFRILINGSGGAPSVGCESCQPRVDSGEIRAEAHVRPALKRRNLLNGAPCEIKSDFTGT